jgi:hypothetical protein
VRKIRDDSTWLQLTPEERETLESWLFDENLGYEKTIERVKKEFGMEGTVASLGRYYRRRARERQDLELMNAQLVAMLWNKLPVNTDELRAAAMKLVAKAVLKLAIEKPDDLQQLASLTKLLLDSEKNDIRRSRLKLAEKYFDIDTFAAAQKDFPRIKAYLRWAEGDPLLNNEEKMNRVGEALFGTSWPKMKSEPEYAI